MENINTIAKALQSSPIQIFSILIQVSLFTFSITHLVSAMLAVLNFSYALPFAKSRLAQYGTIFAFIYLKAWGTWHFSFELYGYFSAIVITLYACDCCCSIAKSYTHNVRGFYYGQVIFYVVFTMLLPLYYLHNK